MDEFSSFLEGVKASTGPIIIAGNFNFHLHIKEDSTRSTEIDIPLNATNLLENVKLTGLVIPDHSAIHWVSLNAKPTKKLPSHNKPRDLAEIFVSFFELKVQTICSNFPSISPTSFPQREMLF